MILTSGTLEPIDNYINTLGLDRRYETDIVKLTNDHVIKDDQLLAITLTGTDGVEFKNTYENRNEVEMFDGYASVIGIFLLRTKYRQLIKSE